MQTEHQRRNLRRVEAIAVRIEWIVLRRHVITPPSSLPLRRFSEPLDQAAMVAHQRRRVLGPSCIEVQHAKAPGCEQRVSLNEGLAFAMGTTDGSATGDIAARPWTNECFCTKFETFPNASHVLLQMISANQSACVHCILPAAFCRCTHISAPSQESACDDNVGCRFLIMFRAEHCPIFGRVCLPVP